MRPLIPSPALQKGKKKKILKAEWVSLGTGLGTGVLRPVGYFHITVTTALADSGVRAGATPFVCIF
jgi:hypothetical protein